MSLLSILMDELDWFDGGHNRNLLERKLGPDFVYGSMPRLAAHSGVCPLRLRGARDNRIVRAKNEDVFKVNVDVQQFMPEEISVKLVDDFLVVEAKHEEKEDQHGFISRQFTRRYKLPEDVDTKALVSKLSSDGVLSLEAPKKKPSGATSIEIPIIHTNQPSVRASGDAKQSEKVGDN